MNKRILINYINKGLSQRQIAKELNCSQGKIKYWMQKYNLKTKAVFKRHEYSENELRNAVKNSVSYSQVLFHLGRTKSSAAYKVLKKRLQYYEIDISHFTGQSHGKGGVSCKSLEEILIKNSAYSNIRWRVIKEQLLPYKCVRCGISTWMQKKLSLHLDHINGNNRDNRIENLRFLCPNCHSQTPTFGSKNKLKQACS